jgi:hypothetical protein
MIINLIFFTKNRNLSVLNKTLKKIKQSELNKSFILFTYQNISLIDPENG